MIGIGVDETQTGCAEGPEVVHPSVVNCESGSNRKVVEVSTELGVMSANGPGEVVSKLVTLFDPLNIRIGLASEESEAGNVHSGVGSSRNGRVVEVRKTAAGVLKPKLIYPIVSDSPSVLRGSGHVAIGLLRSTRISILPKGLVLAADLNAGHRTRAYIGAEHESVVIAQVVVDAQRVETRALKHWEVSNLRCQGLIRRRDRGACAARRTARREPCPR